MYDTTNNYYNAPQWIIIVAGSYSLLVTEESTITSSN